MKLEKAIPQLPSLDFAESKGFYSKKLGFDLVFENESTLVLRKDSVEIHLWKCGNKVLPENSSCYIHVKDIDQWYKECSSHGIVHPDAKLQDKPYGMREFIVPDCHGNFLKFGESIK